MRFGALGILLAVICLWAPALAQAQTPPATADSYPAADTPEPNVNFTVGTGTLTSAGEPLAPGSSDYCGQSGVSVQIDKTVWYKVVGTGGRIVLSARGVHTTFDTVNALYAANQLPSSSTDELCSDDVAGTRQSELSFNSVAGATYYTQWGGCASHAGCGLSSGTLGYAVLTNDQRSHAAPAVNGTRTTLGAGTDPGEALSCGAAGYGNTVWFRWQAPADGRVTFTTARFDLVTALYRGSSTSPLTCNDNAGGVLQSAVSADVRRGEQLFLQVGSKGARENFTLDVGFAEDTDIDNDGFARTPGPDCNDGNPNIKPGVRDVPHNGVDEDCAGGDNRDGDGDGQAVRPIGTDCNDGNPAHYKGAKEIPGNNVDENCDGKRPAARLSPEPAVSFASVAQLRGRLFGTLKITRLARGYRVVVRCRGSRACPKGSFRKTARNRRRIQTRKFSGAMPPGARIQISITWPRHNRFGVFKEYAVSAPRAVAIRECRLSPGSGKRSRCRRV